MMLGQTMISRRKRQPIVLRSSHCSEACRFIAMSVRVREIYSLFMPDDRQPSEPGLAWLARSQSPEFYYKEARAAGLWLWAPGLHWPPLYTHTLGIVTFKPKLQIDFARHRSDTGRFNLSWRHEIWAVGAMWASFQLGARQKKRPRRLRGSAARN